MLLRYRPKIGHAVIGFGAALSLWWIYLSEKYMAIGNSWIAMNTSDRFSNQSYVHYSQLKIFCTVLLLATLLRSITRLTPSQWRFRSRPVNQRTWPAIIITVLFIVTWFARSVVPYRQPIILDAWEPDLTILHVKKDGLTYHETLISVYRNGRYYVAKNDRQLFHYSFRESTQEGVLKDDLRAELTTIELLPEFKRTLNRPAKALRAIHAEGWYIDQHSRGTAIAVFTTENSTSPPKRLVDFVQDIENVPSHGQVWHSTIRDVCLQFCYDPIAGLGYRAENQRCRTGLDNKEHCL